MWRRQRRRALDGLDDEIRDHLDRETEINVARGMSPDEARRQARLAFGNVALVQDDARAAWTWAWLEHARQDVSFGVRILKNSPGLSLSAAVLIALVIGINTTIFSMVNAMVTRPAPGITREGLIRIAVVDRPGAPFVSYPDYLDYAAQTTTLQSLTAFTNGRVTVTADSGSRGHRVVNLCLRAMDLSRFMPTAPDPAEVIRRCVPTSPPAERSPTTSCPTTRTSRES